MFRLLAINTAFSAGAFFIVSIVGLLLVPLIVATYGLDAFGIIAILRLLLPTGLLGFADIGFSESATLTVAKARIDRNWTVANAQLALIFLLSLITSFSLALTLYYLSEYLVSWLNVGVSYSEVFVSATKVCAFFLLILFPSLVIEGIVKGFEKYRSLRLIEVLSSLFYAGTTLLVVAQQWIFVAAFYTLLASLVLKSAITWVLFLRCRDNIRLFQYQDISREKAAVFNRCKLIGWGKLLSTIQHQAGPFLIAVLLTPAAVGIYDILVRLPRFIKSIFGLLNSALLPFAAKLDAANDAPNMRRLGQSGYLLLSITTIPILSGTAVLSEPILRLWIGVEVEHLWGWQSIMFLVPALNVFVSFGSAALMARTNVIIKLNRLLTVQLFLQFSLSWIFISQFGERSFILGQVASVLFTFGFQMFTIFREQNVGEPVIKQIAGICTIAAFMIFITFVNGFFLEISNLYLLLLSLGIWIIGQLGLIYLIILSKSQKKALWEMATYFIH